MTIKLTATRTTEKSSWYFIEEIGIKVCGKKNVDALEAYINSLALPVEDESLYEFAYCDIPVVDNPLPELTSQDIDISLEELQTNEEDENIVENPIEVLQDEDECEAFSDDELDSLHDDLASYGFAYWDGAYTYEMGLGSVEYIKAKYSEERGWYFWFSDKWGAALEEFYPSKDELCSNGKLKESYMEMLFNNV